MSACFINFLLISNKTIEQYKGIPYTCTCTDKYFSRRIPQYHMYSLKSQVAISQHARRCLRRRLSFRPFRFLLRMLFMMPLVELQQLVPRTLYFLFTFPAFIKSDIVLPLTLAEPDFLHLNQEKHR